MKRTLLFLTALLSVIHAYGQTVSGSKIKHLEPLQVDLIRPLDAGKAHREFEIDIELESQHHYDELALALEYEYSFSDRLGMEVQLPLSFYRIRRGGMPAEEQPRNSIEQLRLGLQYTIARIPGARTTMALALIHECHFHSFRSITKSGSLMKGTSEIAALIVAKRWGRHFHTMFYIGPEWNVYAGQRNTTSLQSDMSIYYQLTRSNFIGVEYVCRGLNPTAAAVYPATKMMLNKRIDVSLAAAIPAADRSGRISFEAGFEIKL